MYIFGLPSVLFIQKLSAAKELKLVKRGFRQKMKNTLRTLDASNLKTETIL